MKTYNKRYLLVILLVVLVTNFGCQNKDKEIPPFFNGLYFRYKVTTSSGSYEELFTIKEMRSGYEITEERLTPVFPEKVNNIVDIYGFIKESAEIKETGKKTRSIKWHKGRRICIWIPPKELKIDNKFETSLGNFRAVEQTTWESWDVWVLQDSHGNKCFYDRETGFYVGIQSVSAGLVGSMKKILIETNADIPH